MSRLYTNNNIRNASSPSNKLAKIQEKLAQIAVGAENERY